MRIVTPAPIRVHILPRLRVGLGSGQFVIVPVLSRVPVCFVMGAIVTFVTVARLARSADQGGSGGLIPLQHGDAVGGGVASFVRQVDIIFFVNLLRPVPTMLRSSRGLLTFLFSSSSRF